MMCAKNPWPRRVVSALILSATASAASPAADDVFVERGVIVKPIPKWKQRQLEKKILRRPGSQVVIEGRPAAVPGPDALSSVRTRRAFRPLFPGLFDRRNEIIVGPSVVTSPGGTVVAGPSTSTSSARPVVTGAAPGAIVSTPRGGVAPDDPLVLPGSAEESITPRVVRPPVVSAPRVQTTPPPVDEPDLEPERPAASRALPAPAEEIPPPVVSTPRPGLDPATPAPAPVAEPIPAPTLPTTPAPVDPGPAPATPPAPAPAPAVEPASAPAEPRLDPPLPAPKPA